MKFQTIFLTRKFNLGNYQTLDVHVEAVLADGESPEKALHILEGEIKRFWMSSYDYPSNDDTNVSATEEQKKTAEWLKNCPKPPGYDDKAKTWPEELHETSEWLEKETKKERPEAQTKEDRTKLPFDVTKIVWQDRTNTKGPFQISNAMDNPEHQNLLTFLQGAGGSVESGDFWYWTYPDFQTVGRKVSTKKVGKVA